MSVPPPTTAPRPPRGFEWWSPFVALLSAYGAALVLVVILAGATGNTDGDLPPAITLIATFLQDVLLIGAMIGFATLTAGRVTPATFGLRRLGRREAWRAAGLGAALLVAFFVFVNYWSKLDPGTTDDLAKDLGADESAAALVAVAVLVAFVAPVVEELFFRGFLFGALRGVMHWVPAALLAGIVFGFVHAGGTPAIFLVPLALLGFALCFLYWRTGSLLPGIAVHALNNSIALGASLKWDAGDVILLAVAAPTVLVFAVSRLAER